MRIKRREEIPITPAMGEALEGIKRRVCPGRIFLTETAAISSKDWKTLCKKYGRRKGDTPETSHKRAIKEFLLWNNCFVYHNLNSGIGVYRGIPDLTAITPEGIVLQIEVKAGTKQSPQQRDFEDEWVRRGGISLLGGVDVVIDWFKARGIRVITKGGARWVKSAVS